MYILSNALLNVWRNRGRNALLGAAVLVVIATSVVAMMITTTAGGIIDDYRDRFSSEVKLTPDIAKIRDEAMADSEDGAVRLRMPTISADQYLAFGESGLLADAAYTASTGIVPDGLTVVDEDLGGGGGPMVMAGPAGPGAPAESEAGAEPDLLEFMANLKGGDFTAFADGQRELVDGAMPAAAGEVIVSSDLAELNDLAVGDTFAAAGQLRKFAEDPADVTTKDISYDLTVVGVYDDVTDEYGGSPMRNAFTNTRNEILTTYDTVLAEYRDGLDGIQVSATYHLADPADLPAFEAEVRAAGLDDSFEVTTDTATYEAIVGPVDGLRSVAVTFMIVVLVLGGVIIALLSSIAIRERRYEIGVLRAMGMKKRLVGLGLWLESLVLTGVCLVAGLGLGVVVAQPVTDALLAGQVAALEEAQAAAAEGPMGAGPVMRLGGAGFGGPEADAEPLSELAVQLTPEAMGQVAAVALALATLAGLVALGRITRYEPMTILSERS